MSAGAPPGLIEAFDAYERALMANDLPALDALFAPGEQTLRGDAAGLLVGHEQISAFRGGRGGAPRRTIVQTRVQVIDQDHALIVAVTELSTGGRGQQTQLWARRGRGWVVTAAHVSTAAPALDSRIWRIVGDPLVGPTRSGLLNGESVAVKDLFAIAGHRLGAGNPAWLERAPVEPRHAAAVQSLLDHGAGVRGIARTDELAYSLAGTNAHYGTPPNPQAPHRISGGSSSGSASAVSSGHATIGLGTDTGGSIRVPASYQGLWGIRTSHGAVSMEGILPLAGSFDTVGWMTRGPSLLAAVGSALLPGGTTPVGDVVTADGLLALAEPDVAASLVGFTEGARRIEWPMSLMPQWLAAFQALQAWEAWQVHGPWVTTHADSLGSDVAGRFRVAGSIDRAVATAAKATVREARQTIRDAIGDHMLIVPSASSVAPRTNGGAQLDEVRRATMHLTCIAGLGGLPAVSIPTTTTDGLPVGVCVVGPAGSDHALIAAAAALHQRHGKHKA